MKKILKKILSITLILSSGLSLIGCTDNESRDSIVDLVIDEDLTPVDDLVADLQLRFAREDRFDFTEPLVDVPRDYTFTFDITTEAIDIFSEISGTEAGTFQANDVMGVYRDSAFTQQVSFAVGGSAEEEYLTVGPPRNPVFYVNDQAIGGNPFPQGEFNDWGNANQYFLVKYYDLITGQELERPVVTVFNIATEISGAPRAKFNVSDDGFAGLVWDSVAGAEEYAVIFVRENRDGRGIGRTTWLIHQTESTYWSDIHANPGQENRNFNMTFHTYSLDFVFGYYMNHEDGGNWTLEEFMMQDWDLEYEEHEDFNLYFAVVALNSDGTSSFSNLVDLRSVAPQVPIRVAENLNEGGVTPTGVGSNSSGRFERDVMSAPSHAWIVTADGLVTQNLINYDISRAREQTLLGAEFEVDEDGNTVHDEEGRPIIVGDLTHTPSLVIPYHIEGTPFRGYVEIVEHDEATFDADLQELEIRQDELRSRTGNIERTVNLNPEATAEISHDDTTATALRSDFEVSASSPLTAFLAIQMLNSQNRISLDDFPEASDHEYLVEAWFEAILQNPLILGPRTMQLDWVTGDILITYDHNAQEQQRQQRAIMERVDEIVDEIIVPGMTDLEMQTAINDFLIENATYDFGALENAEGNNFMFVDSEYYDSFTAYGILINGIGVCSGYADAFTLIANQAGLESVIVTGYLLGSLPHAWNRVNIEGQWYTLDVTNNDNELFPNAFFNLSDVEAATILTEDDRWKLTRELPNFVATSVADVEYYRYNDLFFNQREIVEALVDGIINDQWATYRTDVMLTEEQFISILLEVMEITGNFDLVGGHFLGIITLFEE